MQDVTYVATQQRNPFDVCARVFVGHGVISDQYKSFAAIYPLQPWDGKVSVILTTNYGDYDSGISAECLALDITPERVDDALRKLAGLYPPF